METLFDSKKGQIGLNQIPGIVQIVVVIAIVLGVGALIVGKVRDSMTASTTEYNATQTGLEALEDLADYQTTWVAVIGAVVLLGMVAAFLIFK